MGHIHYEKVFQASLIVLALLIVFLSSPNSSFGLKVQSHVNIGLATCSENDKGNNPSLPGQTCTGNGCQADRCESNKILKEYFCDNGALSSANTTCTGSCYGRACRIKPNFLVIVSDDMDWELHGFMGSTYGATPNVDAIASKANVFQNSQSTMSVCRPVLASLASGKFPNENYIFHNHPNLTTPNNSLLVSDSLIDDLRDAGYNTFIGGKWWESPGPTAYGFTHLGEPAPDFVRVTQASVTDFLDDSASLSEPKPFFMWYAPSLPHAIHDAPLWMEDLFANLNIQVPPWVPAEEQENFISDQKKFLANIYRLDYAIGEVMTKLTATGQDKNTIVIYLVDNGFSYGHLSKYSMFEKGLRSPLLIKVPQQLATARQFSQPASTVDVTRLILDYAGLDTRELSNSRTWDNLYGLVDSQMDIFRPRLVQGVYSASMIPLYPEPFQEYAAALFTIIGRDSRYKYIYYTRDLNEDAFITFYNMYAEPLPIRQAGDEDLYDLVVDPYEKNNLSDQPEYASILQSFHDQVVDYYSKFPSAQDAQIARSSVQSAIPSDQIEIKDNASIPCSLNQAYTTKSRCTCLASPSISELVNNDEAYLTRWSIFEDDGILCTPDHQPKYVCRNIKMDLRKREAFVPGEVRLRAQTGVALETLSRAVDENGGVVRQQSCRWNPQDKFNTLVVEVPVGQENQFLDNLRATGLTLGAHRLGQNICIPQG